MAALKDVKQIKVTVGDVLSGFSNPQLLGSVVNLFGAIANVVSYFKTKSSSGSNLLNEPDTASLSLESIKLSDVVSSFSDEKFLGAALELLNAITEVVSFFKSEPPSQTSSTPTPELAHQPQNQPSKVDVGPLTQIAFPTA